MHICNHFDALSPRKRIRLRRHGCPYMNLNTARTRKRANAPVSLINILMVQSLHPVLFRLFSVGFFANSHFQ